MNVIDRAAMWADRFTRRQILACVYAFVAFWVLCLAWAVKNAFALMLAFPFTASGIAIAALVAIVE